MTKQEKQLLLKDLCARLPYRVKISCFDVPRTLESISIDCDEFVTIDCGGEHFYHPLSNILHEDCLPYLRPMSSMTEEERLELSRLTDDKFKFYLYTTKPEIICYEKYNYLEGLKVLDWLNAHHFDWRGLIPMGLALEAPEGMYK